MILLQQDSLRKGIIYILIAEALLAIMAALIKQVSSELPSEVIVFFRNLLGLFFLFPLVFRAGIHTLKTHQLHYHLIRGLAGVTAMYGYFYMISKIPLAEAALVKLTSPFFLPFIAAFWLGDKMSRITWAAIGIGFIGVIFVLQPGTENFKPIIFLGLGAAALASLAKVTIRKMGYAEPSIRVVFYFGVISSLVSSIPLIWKWQMPSLTDFFWLLCIGLTGSLGQLTMTRAYQLTQPGKLGPYVYASLLYTSLLGWFFWGEIMSVGVIFGSILIVVAGFINILDSKQRQKGKEGIKDIT